MKRLAWIKIALAAFALIFVGHQLYASLYSSVTTSTALYYELCDGIDISAITVRDETVIKGNGNGVVHYVHDDGEKVAAGGTVARFYSSGEVSVALTELESLHKRLSDVNEIMNYNDTSATDMDLCNQKVDNAIYSFETNAAGGNFESISNDVADILTSVNRRQVATGESDGFAAVKASLEEKIASLESKVTNPTGSVVTERSGYFVSDIDGYEKLLTVKKLDDITPSELKDIKPDATDTTGFIGKISSDYVVYFAAVLPYDKAHILAEGNVYTVQTQIKACKELKCTVTRISEPDDERNCVVVLSCSQMNSELATIRSFPMKIVIKKYEGLKVSSKALRVVDGRTGVYVVSALQAKFVETDVVYTGDSFIICKLQNSDTGRLRLYDEVIEKGSGLYDGKIID